MRKLLLLLILSGVLFSCKKKTEPEPENTDFIEALGKTTYGENASVSIELKVFPYKHATDLSVDWGDGKTENSKFDIRQSSTDAIFTFSHTYAKNGNYKVIFKAVNPVVSNSVETEVKITNKAAEPVADFSYEILENGKVRFKNLSPAVDASYYWGGTKTQHRSSLVNPEFIYEKNDEYPVFLTVTDKFGQKTTITKDIKISNAITKEVASFKGMIFNQYYEFSENDKDCKTVLSETDALSTRLLNSIVLNSSDTKIDIGLVGMFHVLGSGNPEFNISERVDKLRQYLTAGSKRVGVQMHDQWNASIKYETKNGAVSKAFTDVANASIEIIDVKEADQPILFDGLHKQSFWVTFRLRADFQGVGKIDCTLKIRYLVYKMI